MPCYLKAPHHYLNQCWQLINEVLKHSRKGNFKGNVQAIDLYMGPKMTYSTLQPYLSENNGVHLISSPQCLILQQAAKCYVLVAAQVSNFPTHGSRGRSTSISSPTPNRSWFIEAAALTALHFPWPTYRCETCRERNALDNLDNGSYIEHDFWMGHKNMDSAWRRREGNPLATVGFCWHCANNVEFWCILCY